MRIPIIVLSLATLVFISCKKDNVPAVPSASFSFKVDNTSYSWNFEPDSPRLERGARLRTVLNPNTNAVTYALEGWDTPRELGVLLLMNTSSPAVSTYKTVIRASDPYAESISNFDHTRFATKTDDYSIITITNISGDYASGSFYAVMHDLATSSRELRIFNGSFNHILIQK